MSQLWARQRIPVHRQEILGLDLHPELTPDQSGGPGYQPEIEPDRAPSLSITAVPETGPMMWSPDLERPIRPDHPSIPPDHPTPPGHPESPHIRPDIDPDIPEKPGPPLNDPENPHGKY